VRFDHAELALRDFSCIGELHGEQQRVDAVRAGRHDLHLRTTLAAAFEERARILEIVAVDIPCDHAPAGQRLAVACLDDADLALRDGRELDQFDRVLPRPQAHVQARRQRVGLVAGFAFERNDLPVGQVAVAAEDHEFLRHRADAVVGNDDDAE